jgi:hypothetical protein
MNSSAWRFGREVNGMGGIEWNEGERLDLKLELSEGRRVERGGGVWRIEAVALLEATHARKDDASAGQQPPSIEGGKQKERE